MIKGLISLKTLIQNNGQNKHVFLERQLMSHMIYQRYEYLHILL